MKPKFRAWLKEENEMIIVDTMNWFDDEFESIGDGVTFLRGAEKIELMQSTGLCDKNGKEIFEGDIIRYNIDVVDIKRHPTLGFYTVLDGREGFFGDGMSIDDFEEDAKEFSKTAEIIGNIYENPELLEVENEQRKDLCPL